MNCEKMFELMNETLDGVIDASNDKKLQNHLKTCTKCREIFEQMQQNDAAIRSELPPVPQGLSTRIMQVVQADKKQHKKRIWQLAASGFAAAALLGLVIFGSIKLPADSPKEQFSLRTASEPVCDATPTEAAFSPAEASHYGNRYSSETSELASFTEQKKSVAGDAIGIPTAETGCATSVEASSVLFLPADALDPLPQMEEISLDHSFTLMNDDAFVFLSTSDFSDLHAYEVEESVFAALAETESAHCFPYTEQSEHYIVFVYDLKQ